MVPLLVVATCLLISGLSCSSSRYNYHQEDFYFSFNDEDKSDRFYNPDSRDFNQYLTDLVGNVHPLLADHRSNSSTYDMDNMINFVSKIGSRMNIDFLQSCIDLDAELSSGTSTMEEMKYKFLYFLRSTGLFDYMIYSQKDADWILLGEEKEDDNETRKATKSRSNKNKKKRKKTEANSKNENEANKPQPIAQFYHPDMKSVHEALEHNVCQKTFAISIHCLDAADVAELFRNAPFEILDNPEILLAIDNFSEFKDPESVDKLVKLYSIGTVYAMQHQLTPSLTQTLPLEALHKVVEARNFDLSADEVIMLLKNRSNFKSQEPFLGDHRTFRLFCAENKLFPFPGPSFIMNGQPADGAIDINAIENILAYYIRSELGIDFQTKHLFKLYDAMSSGSMSLSEFEYNSLVPINDLINMFTERFSLITFMRQERDVDESVQDVYYQIARLLEIPLSGMYRFLMITEITAISKLPSYLFGKQWKALLVHHLDDQILVSPGYKNLLCTLSKLVFYDVSDSTKLEDIYDYWNSIVTSITSPKFRIGRWNRNFLSFLFSSVHPSELICLRPEFVQKVSSAFALYPRMQSSDFVLMDPNVFTDHSWFIEPVKKIIDEQMTQNVSKRIVRDYEFIRDLRRIFAKLDLSNDALVDAIWRNSSVVVAFNLYPFCMSQDNIDDLMSCATGMDFLKNNPFMLARLPSYCNFTIDDIEFFGLRLDGFLAHANTFNSTVVNEWLFHQRYIVNSTSRILLRQIPAVSKDNPDCWQLLGVEVFLSYPDKVLKVSEHLDELLDITSAFENESTLYGKLSLVARFLIHMETQFAISWIFSKFYAVRGNEKVLGQYFNELYQNKTLLKPELKKLASNPKLSKDEKKDCMSVLELMEDSAAISSFKIFTSSSVTSDLTQAEAQYAAYVKNNEFVRYLIENGFRDDDKSKRVWFSRARFLVLFDPKKNIQPCDDLKELVRDGLLPVSDAIFFWFIINFKDIIRVKIFIETKARKGERPEFPPEFLQNPEFHFIKFLFMS